MTTDDHTDPLPTAAHPWADQAPAYAVGALDADERTAFEAHLGTCGRCQAEVRAYAEVAVGLAAAVAVEPPPALRARIVDAARAAPVAPVAPTPVVDLAVRRAAAASRPAPRTARPRAPWLAAAASLLLAAGFGVEWARERSARRDAELAVVAARRTQQASAAAVAGRDSLVAALLAPDLQSARLAPTRPIAVAGPDVRVYWERSRGVVVLAAAAMPAAPRGRTYQLWGIQTGRTPQSLGTFDMPPSGDARIVLHVPVGAAMDVVAITEEPAGGSVTPAGAPIVAGALRGGAA